MLVGNPPGAAGRPIGRLPAISVTAPLAGSIWMMRLAPTSATISLPWGASANAFGHLQVLGDDVLLAIGLDLRNLSGKRFSDVEDVAGRGDKADRPLRGCR